MMRRNGRRLLGDTIVTVIRYCADRRLGVMWQAGSESVTERWSGATERWCGATIIGHALRWELGENRQTRIISNKQKIHGIRQGLGCQCHASKRQTEKDHQNHSMTCVGFSDIGSGSLQLSGVREREAWTRDTASKDVKWESWCGSAWNCEGRDGEKGETWA